MDLENGDGKRLRSRHSDMQQASREKIDRFRASLIETIRSKLVSYGSPALPEDFGRANDVSDELLVKTRDLNAFQKPSNRDYRSFRTWFWNKKPSNYEPEEEFIKRREDLVSLRHGREWSSFDGIVESCIRKLHCRPLQVRIICVYAC